MAAKEGNVVEEFEATKREEVLREEIMTLRSQLANHKKEAETVKAAQQVTMEDLIKYNTGTYQATLVKFVMALRKTVHDFMVNVHDFQTNVLNPKRIPIAPKICEHCGKPRIKLHCSGDHADETVDGLEDCSNKLHELTDIVIGELHLAIKKLKSEQNKADRIRDEAHKCFMDIITRKKHNYTIEYASSAINFHIEPHPVDTRPEVKVEAMKAPGTGEISSTQDDDHGRRPCSCGIQQCKLMTMEPQQLQAFEEAEVHSFLQR